MKLQRGWKSASSPSLSLSLSESSPFHSRSRSSFHLVQFSVLHSSPDPNPALADPRRRLISSAAISSPHFPALKALVENCFEEHITSVIAPCFAPQVRLNCAFTWHRVKSSDCQRLGIVSKRVWKDLSCTKNVILTEKTRIICNVCTKYDISSTHQRDITENKRIYLKVIHLQLVKICLNQNCSGIRVLKCFQKRF